jgi:hypothetical protein
LGVQFRDLQGVAYQALTMEGRMKFRLFAAAILLAQATSGLAGAPKVGDTVRIVRTQESTQESADGSESTSSDRDALIERVVTVRSDGGVELEYDLPKDSGDRSSQWQFPARILRPLIGPMELLNRPELEARRDHWLKAAKLSQEACGRWIFTWNALQIECDPETAIKDVETFDITSQKIAEGAAYAEPGTIGSATLASAGSGTAALTAELEIDPNSVRRASAQSDVIVGEISQKPVTLDAALRDHQADVVTGTMKVTFERNGAGEVFRKTTVTKMTVKTGNQSETRTVTQKIERQRF